MASDKKEKMFPIAPMSAELEDVAAQALILHRETGGKTVSVSDGKRKCEIKAGLDDADKVLVHSLLTEGMAIASAWPSKSTAPVDG